MLEAPPMELKKIDRFDAKSLAAALDALAHDLGVIAPRRRAPFGESGGAHRPGGLAARDARQKAARDELGAAVMVRHVESVEAGACIVEHAPMRRAPGSSVRPPRSMSATCQRPTTTRLISRSARARRAAAHRMQARSGAIARPLTSAFTCSPLYLASFALIALTSSVLISPTVVTLPSTIFQSRNGPVMSPYWSNDTGPMTPS